MKGIGKGGAEILVHTSAPSRGQDDTRYRALARSYLDFEPATHRGLDEGSQSRALVVVGKHEDIRLQEELLHSTLEDEASTASYRPENDPGHNSVEAITPQHRDLGQVGFSQTLDSPDISFDSALDNADSPAFRGLLQCVHNPPQHSRQSNPAPDSAGSWRHPPSVVADSQPENSNSMPQLSSPTTVLQFYLRHICGSEKYPQSGITSVAENVNTSNSLPLASKQNLPSTPEGRHQGFSQISAVSFFSPTHAGQKRSERLQSYVNINTSMQVQAVPLKKRRAERGFENDDISSSATTKNDAPIPTPARSTTARKRKCAPPYSPEANSRTSFTSSIHGPTVRRANTPRTFIKTISNSLEIRPAPPATSVADFTVDTLFTKSLLQLAHKLPLNKIFRPKQRTREPRSMERGYWLVTSQMWDTGLRQRSWSYLNSYIGKGEAGWGVWAIRDEDFGLFRVYCWGQIVGHIYLLLYIATESKIRGTGTSWIAGDGEAIIKMPS